MIDFFVALVLTWSAVDADTLAVKGYVWARPVRTIEERVRLVRVDAPEMRGVPDCEKALAAKAKAWAETQLVPGSHIVVKISTDERQHRDNFGRLLGDVIVNGVSLSDAGLAAGVFRPFSKGPKAPWC